MARMRVFVVLLLAITVGSALAFGTYNYMQKAPVQVAGAQLPTKPVVVAAAELKIGDELKKEDLKVLQWPAASAPDGSFGNPDELVGRGVIVPVVQNELILPMKLASKEAGSGLPPAIPPGLRAMSVRVNEVIGVAGYVLPGNRVDVIATVSPSEKQADTTSKVILTNVQVLTAGTKIEQDSESNKPMAVSVVTLLVNPDEAERLTLASGAGKIQLALRNPLDTQAPPTRGIRAMALIGSAPPVRTVRRSAQAPQAAPVVAPVVEPMTVEMIRGDKRAHEVVRGE
jgi:pilus assembly protein CpaB